MAEYYLPILKILTFSGFVLAGLLWYKDRQNIIVLGISMAFFSVFFYYNTDPTDIDFVRKYGRLVAIVIFFVINIDLYLRLRRARNGNT